MSMTNLARNTLFALALMLPLAALAEEPLTTGPNGEAATPAAQVPIPAAPDPATVQAEDVW